MSEEVVYTVPLTTSKASLLEEIEYRSEHWGDSDFYEGFAAFIEAASDETMQDILDVAVTDIFDNLHQSLASFIFDVMRNQVAA